tara:strand:+ start:83 stop:766 length:684 start_codon:yes stop_codon:yes gene_type:complete
MKQPAVKSIHSKVGLLNILFTPGASGTFLASMLAQAIRDPWWEDYVPVYHNELFRVTNEFLNPFNHIAMTWHPVNLKERTHEVLSLKDINWINLTITPEEAKFTKVLWAIKRQDMRGVTKEDILHRLSSDTDDEYKGMHLRQKRIASHLAVNNNVLDVKFSDVFVDGNTDVILSILNTVYKGNYVAKNVVDNVSAQCIAKHKADIKLHDELLVPDGDGLIDYILAQV